MPHITSAVKRVEHTPRPVGDHDTRGPGSPPETSAAVGRWTAGLLSAAGTLALAYLISPGLRPDLGGLATLLGNISAAGIESWLLSFGALSPVVYFLSSGASSR